MCNVNAARPCLVSSLGLFSAPAHTLEKRGGGNWQQLAMTVEEAKNCPRGGSTGSARGSPQCSDVVPWAGVRAGSADIGLLGQCSLAFSHAVQFCNTEVGQNCPVLARRQILLLYFLCFFSSRSVCRQTAFTMLLRIQAVYQSDL